MNSFEARLQRTALVCLLLCGCAPTSETPLDTTDDLSDAVEEVDLAPPPPSGTVRLEVGPVGMTPPVSVTYSVEMVDASGNSVGKVEGLTSKEDGSLTTELSCPPQAEGVLLDVHLLLDSVKLSRPLVEGDDFFNPCAKPGDCTRRLPCIDGRTETAKFDFYVARPEEDGMFDFGLQFGGMTCTLGVSCKDALLFVDGQRVRSHVVNFTCLGPASTALNLWMDDLTLDCDSGDITLDAATPKGNQTAVGPVDMWANYRGEEASGSKTKHYWSIALALSPTEHCTVKTRGTSSLTQFAEGVSPAFFRYPYMSVDALIHGDRCDDGLTTISDPLGFAYSEFATEGVCFGNHAEPNESGSDPIVSDTRCGR